MEGLKNQLKIYLKYLRNNPEGYWFKRKLYGWGWTPVRVEGWLTIIVFIVLVIANSYRLENKVTNPNDMVWPFVLETVLMTGILLWICYKKGESPRWQWGLPEEEREEDKEDSPLHQTEK